MEDLGFINNELIFGLVFVGFMVFKAYAAFKQQGDQDQSEAEIIEEYNQELGGEIVKGRDVLPKPGSTNIEQSKHHPAEAPEYDYDLNSVAVDSNNVEDELFGVDDFDMRKAVIMSEILQPKFRDEQE